VFAEHRAIRPWLDGFDATSELVYWLLIAIDFSTCVPDTRQDRCFLAHCGVSTYSETLAAPASSGVTDPRREVLHFDEVLGRLEKADSQRLQTS